MAGRPPRRFALAPRRRGDIDARTGRNREENTMPLSEGAVRAHRWSQLWLGVLCMVLIANLQYAWTLFVNPMHQARGWSFGEIQFAFSIFIALETWVTPLDGWIVDRLGPRRGPPIMIGIGGVLGAGALFIHSLP